MEPCQIMPGPNTDVTRSVGAGFSEGRLFSSRFRNMIGFEFNFCHGGRLNLEGDTMSATLQGI